MPEAKAVPAVEPRVAFLNAPDKNQHLIATKRYARNVIVTSKYTIASFVPKTIFEFFRVTANIYFLAISLLQVRSPRLRSPLDQRRKCTDVACVSVHSIAGDAMVTDQQVYDGGPARVRAARDHDQAGVRGPQAPPRRRQAE